MADPVIVTGVADEISSVSAVLNAEVTSMSDATSLDCSFEYGPDTGYGTTIASVTLTAAGVFEATISELDPETTYHFRAVITDGTTTWNGSDATLLTLEGTMTGNAMTFRTKLGEVYIAGAWKYFDSAWKAVDGAFEPVIGVEKIEGVWEFLVAEPAIDPVLYIVSSGADLNTTFTDLSASAHTITNNNSNVYHSDDQYKFGSTAMYFDGATLYSQYAYLKTPASLDFNFGIGDFTIAFWMRFNNSPDYQYVISIGNGSPAPEFYTNSLYFRTTYNSPSLAWYCLDPDASGVNIGSTNTFPSLGWRHIELCRKDLVFYFFIDGVLVDTVSDYEGVIGYPVDGEVTDPAILYVGRTSDNYNEFYTGYLDEITVVKSALHTENFTVPTTYIYPDLIPA